MPSITVPKDFFISERDTVYANWPLAFWRELISNAMDAGASKIRIASRFTEDGKFRVDFIDNGKGMDREVIENVYMRLGASTKGSSSGSVGGFGRARLLTCFSHEAYKIRTSNLLVTGEGASYEIEERSGDPVKGTALSIDIHPDHAARLTRNLRICLRQSAIRTQVELDMARHDARGEPMSDIAEDCIRTPAGTLRFNAWSRTGKSVGTFEDETGDWATVNLSRGKTANPERAIVRVNGLAMYDEYIAAPVQITVDLVPERSRDVLTASRDSVRGHYRRELQKMFSEIAADNGSGLRERPQEPELAIHGNAQGIEGFLVPREGGFAKKTGLQVKGAGSPAAPLEAEDSAPTPLDAPESRNPSIRSDGGPAPEPQRHPVVGQLRLPALLYVADPTRGQRASLGRYKPGTWVEEGTSGRNAELLHAAWTGACSYMMSVLSEVVPSFGAYSDERWAAGFVVSGKAQGMHKSMGNIRHGLLINPVDENGLQRYKLSSVADLKRMGAIAAHEVTHCIYDWHDEEYAGLLTELMGASYDRDLLRAMKDEIDMTRIWQKDREKVFETRRPEITEGMEL